MPILHLVSQPSKNHQWPKNIEKGDFVVGIQSSEFAQLYEKSTHHLIHLGAFMTRALTTLFRINCDSPLTHLTHRPLPHN
jgi:hypothetical protein